MSNETILVVVGNLTAAPELRFTQNGLAVVNFTVASTPRTFDRQANEWKDGEALFTKCTAWREFAENIAGSLDKGSRVIVRGELRPTAWQDRDGNQRTGTELVVDEIGPSLRYATAQVTRASKNGTQQTPGASWGAQQAQTEPWSTPTDSNASQGQQADTWATPDDFDGSTPF